MRECDVLRVFTRGTEGGNHLGVVTEVAGLTTEAMQEIAAGLGFSETIFIDRRAAGAPRARIFTPAAELPFAGHPLVGAAWVLGGAEPGAAGRIECGVGTIPFRVDDEEVWIEVPLIREVDRSAEGARLASAARLPATGRAWWVRMPIPYLVVEAPSEGSVVAARPDFDVLMAGPAAEAAYLFARDGDRVKARFFAAGLGVPEDPATGSAASALAAVMAFEGEAEGCLTIDQGDEVGFPSRIGLRWDREGVSIGGTVCRDEVRVLER
jgi:trans-2,3-dihydro-3-hydroxyanthranilate isomerase